MVSRSSVIEYANNLGATGDLIKKARQHSSNSSSITIPAANAVLRKLGGKWRFDSEKALKDFVYDNLNSLLGMTPLQRQYYVNSEVGDILAIDHNKRLVVLELKNSENECIVQQLTRYYATLREEKTELPKVNSRHPIRLIAITPRFHKHNLIDRQYSKLGFEFLEFELVQEINHLYLKFQNIDTGKVITAEITLPEKEAYKLSGNIPKPPRALQTILSTATSDAKDRLLEVRERILGFHGRVHEISASGVIKYGRRINKLCAEIRLDSSLNRPFLWLYLPITYAGRPAVGRMKIWTTDWNNIQFLNHIPPNKRNGLRYKIDYFKKYIELAKATNESNQLDILLDIALETWLERI